MNDNEANLSGKIGRRPPWNKGKLVGPKPPLRPSHVWSIRTKLQMGQRTRDLALFNLAIDSKLRGCDVVAVRVDDVAPNGYTVDRATVRQKITMQQGIPVEKAREIVKRIKDSKKRVQASIQGDTVRVSGKDRDALQEIIALLRGADFGIDMQFTNYRSN